MTHLTRIDTGYPAPFHLGSGWFYTPEFIRERQRALRDEPFKSLSAQAAEELAAEGFVPKPPVRRRNVNRHRRVVTTVTKVCKQCQQEFAANKARTLCSQKCRDQWERDYRNRKARERRAAIGTHTPQLTLIPLGD